MQAAGAQILTYYHDISFMGFLEVARNLKKINKSLNKCKADIRHFHPDVVVLVDFPGFNLRIAKYAKSLGIKTCYYISPKLWAWKQSRIKTIRAYVDKMLVIFPFEVSFYEQFDFPAEYVGNASLEHIKHHTYDDKLVDQLGKRGRNIAFLPGSRIQEVKQAIHAVTQLSKTYDEYTFLIAAVSNIPKRVYEPLEDIANVTILYGSTYEILCASEAAVVTSGTASLEAALLGVPQVVVFRTSTISYLIARLLVRVKYISLVNLIAGRRVVKELIQGNYDAMNIATELEFLLNDDATKKRISEGYSEIQDLIGDKSASINAARAIVALGRS